jgi:hypothetical protein
MKAMQAEIMQLRVDNYANQRAWDVEKGVLQFHLSRVMAENVDLDARLTAVETQNAETAEALEDADGIILNIRKRKLIRRTAWDEHVRRMAEKEQDTDHWRKMSELPDQDLPVGFYDGDVAPDVVYSPVVTSDEE